MAPPDEYVLAPGARSFPAAKRAPLGVDRVYLELPVLTDLLMLIALALVLRVLHGGVDFVTASFILGVAVVRSGDSDRSERIHVAALDEVGAAFKAVLFSYAMVAFFTTVIPALGDVRSSDSLTWTAALATPVLVAARSIHYAAKRSSARRGRRARTIVVGAGEVAQELIRSIEDNGSYGLQVVGAVDDRARFTGDALGTRLLGGVGDLGSLVETMDVGAVVVAYGGTRDSETLEMMRTLLSHDIDIWVVPRFFEVGAPVTGFDHIGSVPVVRVHQRVEIRRGWRIKRALDVAVSSLGLLVGGPFLLGIALAIKLDSDGPVLYRQERVGVGGRRFNMLKFRTMHVGDAEQSAAWAVASDRITRVGRLLRKTGLDELPQLLNVLRGDLTLVGPRPERPHYVEMFEALYPHYASRHRVPGGITGWAQIHGLRGDTSIDERARFDNFYIENWSFAQDLKVLLLTWRTWLTRYRGATEGSEQRVAEEVSETRP